MLTYGLATRFWTATRGYFAPRGGLRRVNIWALSWWCMSWVAWVHPHPCVVHMRQVDACVCGATLECMVVWVCGGGGEAAMCASVCLYVLSRDGARGCVCPRGVGVLVTRECARVSTCIDVCCWRGRRCASVPQCAKMCQSVCTRVGMRRTNTFVFSSTHRACNPPPYFSSFVFFPFRTLAPSHSSSFVTQRRRYADACCGAGQCMDVCWDGGGAGDGSAVSTQGNARQRMHLCVFVCVCVCSHAPTYSTSPLCSM